MVPMCAWLAVAAFGFATTGASIAADVATVSQPKSALSKLDSVPAGTWFEIPNSRLQDVLPPASWRAPIRYISGPKAIVSAWNGAVFNTKLQRLDIFASGGHGDYCGNEYLGFSLNTLRWQLIEGPSRLDGFDLRTGIVDPSITLPGIPPEARKRNALGFAPDGRPISRHTYGGQVYDPRLDESFMFGGSLCSGAGTADDRWWSVTPDGRYRYLGGNGAWTGLGLFATYDPSSGNIFLTLAGNVTEYDPVRNLKIPRTNRGMNGTWGQVAAIDPKRHHLLVIGQLKPQVPASRPFVFDTASGRIEFIDLGGAPFLSTTGLGLKYVPRLDRFVVWAGGQTLYYIDPETFAVSAAQTSGAAPKFTPNGMYGRFAYSQAYGGFVVVSAIDENVHFLKLP